MVLEDAHWIDPTTLELVRPRLDRIADARVLMLLTSRPDSQPALGGHPHVTRLTLNRLGRGPTEAIVARLAGGRGLPPAVLGEIAARTDGVPLFVEELTKAVLEAGAARAGGGGAGLAARLADGPAGPGARGQGGGAGGGLHRARVRLPAARGGLALPEPELRAALERLAAAELVFARGEPPEASYAFKHALVRDAAHESLLKSRRQRASRAHRAGAGGALPGDGGREPELLARHYAEAGLAERAVDSLAEGGGAGDRTLGQPGGHRPLRTGRSPAAHPAAVARARAGGARGPTRQGRCGPSRPGLRRAGSRARLLAGVRALRASWATASAWCTRFAACSPSTSRGANGGTRFRWRADWARPPTGSMTQSRWRCGGSSRGRRAFTPASRLKPCGVFEKGSATAGTPVATRTSGCRVATRRP